MPKNTEWQHQGGALEIPDGWFVCGADFDTDEPYITISNGGNFAAAEDKKIPVPKSMAYYLSTHNCGSQSMRELIKDIGRREVSDTIKGALGL